MGDTGVSRLRMPAEWAPHEASWLAWPYDPMTWIRGVEAAERAFLDMIEALVPGERVELIAHDRAQRDRIEDLLAERAIESVAAPRDHAAAPEQDLPGAGLVRIHELAHIDSWVRDYGPTFVVDETTGELVALDWTFDAWGGKYETLAKDDRLGALIAQRAGARHERLSVTMEGGSLEVDGQGTLLTTEQCLLNENRNPELSQAEIEHLLMQHLGAEQIVWLGRGIEGDDTDGHVDDITRFTGPGHLVTVTEDDPEDPNHEPLAENLDRLQGLETPSGDPIRVTELPMPRPFVHEGQRYPASYANFYIANEVVLMPTFGQPGDGPAMATLSGLFPQRGVVPIDARALIVGMGACHCLTQQQPRV